MPNNASASVKKSQPANQLLLSLRYEKSEKGGNGARAYRSPKLEEMALSYRGTGSLREMKW